MRIVHVKQSFARHGGVETLVRQSAASLAFRHDEVAIINLESQPSVEDEPSLALASLPSMIRGNAKLRLRRPHVVHAHGCNTRRFGPSLRGPWARVWSPYFHAPLPDHHTNPELLRSLHVWWCRWADLVVFVSHAERTAYEQLGIPLPGGVAVIHPGIAHRTGSEPHCDAEFVVALSRLVSHKRLDLVIQATADAGALDRLRIIGDGDDRDRLAAKIVSVGGDPEAVLLGGISDEERHHVLQRAACLVSMSDEESFGIALVEGLAAGAFVIASSIPAHVEALMDAPTGQVRLVQPGDVAGVRHALLDVLQRERMPRADVRTWEAAGKDLRAAYESAVQERRHR